MNVMFDRFFQQMSLRLAVFFGNGCEFYVEFGVDLRADLTNRSII